MAGFAARHNLPHWEHPARSVTGSALGAFFGMSLALITRLGLIPDPERDLVETVEELSHQQASLRRDVPAVHNPAKRMAGQLVGRWVTIIGAGMLVPVARSWKIQINEMAKAGAQFAEIPEADHNLLAAVEQPEASFHQTLTVFLRSAHDLPPNRLRSDLTRKYFMLQGLPTDFVDAQGSTALANLWTCLHFGDFAAYYLAMAYGVDPNARSVITGFKEELAG